MSDTSVLSHKLAAIVGTARWSDAGHGFAVKPKLLQQRVTTQTTPWQHAQQVDCFDERERASRAMAALRRLATATAHFTSTAWLFPGPRHAFRVVANS